VVNPAQIIEQLNAAGVEYVIIGGIAATLHGCPEQTYDLDILYKSSPENRRKLLKALHAIAARWEHPLSEEVLKRQPVFALNTKHGDLDIFSEAPALPSFDDVLPQCESISLGGLPARILNLDL
jgi:hypothetical protein